MKLQFSCIFNETHQFRSESTKFLNGLMVEITEAEVSLAASPADALCCIHFR